MNSRNIVITIVVASAIALVRTSAEGQVVAKRVTSGDTTIVTTVSGSVWRKPMLLQQLIAIGELDGADEMTFGNVQSIAPDQSGGVYVFDNQAPALRHYDRNGKYIGTLGRLGSGPGEYRKMSLGLVVAPDNRVLMFDPQNARINVYDSNHKPLKSIRIASGLHTSNAMTLTKNGELLIKVLTEAPKPNTPFKVGLLRLSADGDVLDTIMPPTLPGFRTSPRIGRFEPKVVWQVGSNGQIAIAYTAKYDIQVRNANGKVIRIIRSRDPVALLPAEKREWQAETDWMRANQAQYLNGELAPVPNTKPYFGGFEFDDAGRLWVDLHVRAVRDASKLDEPRSANSLPVRTMVEPTIYDVFEANGTYLGEVKVPTGVRILSFNGVEAWGVRRGTMDEQYVVKFKLVPSR